MTELYFGFSLGIWLSALIFATIATFLSYRITNPPIGRLSKSALIGLRWIAFLAIFLMIIEPLLVRVVSREIEPEVLVLWDNSESMSLIDRQGDRKAIIDDILNSSAFSDIAKSHTVREFAFSDTVYPKPATLSLDGEVTALGTAISHFRQIDSDKPIGAMIIVTDGQANFGEDYLGASYRSEFPIFTIGVGDPTPPKDIAVRQIAAQSMAYLGQSFPIIATVAANGYSGRESNIMLYANGEKIAEKRFLLPETGGLIDVSFDVTPESEGEITYRAFVPIEADELSSSNNSRNMRVRILPSKRSVLVIGASPNWEVTFLYRTLKRDPDLLVKNAFLGKSSDAGEARVPRNLAEMRDYNAVFVVGAVNELDAMNLGQVLLDYVEQGGAVAFLILGEIRLNRNTANVWAKLFPFIFSAGSHVWMEDNFVPELSVQGLVHSITRTADDATFKPEDYQRLPPLSGFAMITGRPSGTKTLMSHSKLDDVPIFAVREVQRGRVLLMNGAGWWRWGFVPYGFGGDDRIYRNLVSSGASWLLAAGEGSDFTVETDQRVYRSGERVIATARLRDQSNQPLAGAIVEAKFTRQDTLADSLIIVLEDRGDGIYASDLPAFDVGNWRISASASLEDQIISRANAGFLVEPYSIELENVQLNTTALRAISEATDGRFFHASDIESLPQLIETPKLLRKERRERAFWDHPLLLAIFVLALCGEWIIRKKKDLP